MLNERDEKLLRTVIREALNATDRREIDRLAKTSKALL